MGQLGCCRQTYLPVSVRDSSTYASSGSLGGADVAPFGRVFTLDEDDSAHSGAHGTSISGRGMDAAREVQMQPQHYSSTDADEDSTPGPVGEGPRLEPLVAGSSCMRCVRITCWQGRTKRQFW